MTLSLYLTCFLVALVGMALQTALKLKSLQDKTKAGNIEFNPLVYFKNDWLSICASFLTIILFLFFIDSLLKWKPALIDSIKIVFAFVGYTGSDIASRLFSVVNKKINGIIDIKTNVSDAQPETLPEDVPKTIIK